jgi:large conductance mechanosensitive channel
MARTLLAPRQSSGTGTRWRFGEHPAGLRLLRHHGTDIGPASKESTVKGFKNFLMQGELVVIAVGLVVALAFSTLIKAFTDNIITPLVNSVSSGAPGSSGLGFTVNGKFIDIGSFVSAIIYFVIFMAVIYFAIVVPYRMYMKHRGVEVFGDPAPTKACPECLSADLPLAATRCSHCGTQIAAAGTSA